MKRIFLPLLAFASSALACGGPELRVLGVAQPLEDCSTDPASDVLLPELVFDPAQGHTLQIPVLTSNDTNTATKVHEADVRYECRDEASAGILKFPALSQEQSFCLSSQSDSFLGFDVEPTAPSVIAPHARGIVPTTVVSAQWGDAFDATVSLAVLADRCCREGACSRNDQENADCAAFSIVAAAPFEPAEIRAFASLDHAYATSAGLTPSSHPMQLRFVLDGEDHHQASEELSIPIRFCRSCAEPAMSCLH